MVTTTNPGDVLSVRAAAKETGIHFTTLYRWVRDEQIVYITFGGSIFIPVLEVQRLKREKNRKAMPAEA